MHVGVYTVLNDPLKKKKQKTQLYLPCTQLKVTAQSAEAHLFMGINMGYVSKRLKNKFLILLPPHTEYSKYEVTVWFQSFYSFGYQ